MRLAFTLLLNTGLPINQHLFPALFFHSVGLFVAGHGDEPILIDRTPPYPGQVLDGDKLRVDMMYQSSNTSICAQWIDFYDSESGIDRLVFGHDGVCIK